MIIDPQDLFILKELYWPEVTFHAKEVEFIEAAVTTPETYVPAGNKLSKDHGAGFLATAVMTYCEAMDIMCRVVTTSVADHHLKVLWGEIGWYFSNARRALPLLMLDKEIRYQREAELLGSNVGSYLIGRVSAKGEGMAGHHVKEGGFSMLIGDEASGIDDEVYKQGQGWAQHMVWIGNPNPCDNFFRRGCEAGDELEVDESVMISRSRA